MGTSASEIPRDFIENVYFRDQLPQQAMFLQNIICVDNYIDNALDRNADPKFKRKSRQKTADQTPIRFIDSTKFAIICQFIVLDFIRMQKTITEVKQAIYVLFTQFETLKSKKNTYYGQRYGYGFFQQQTLTTRCVKCAIGRFHFDFVSRCNEIDLETTSNGRYGLLQGCGLMVSQHNFILEGHFAYKESKYEYGNQLLGLGRVTLLATKGNSNILDGSLQKQDEQLKAGVFENNMLAMRDYIFGESLRKYEKDIVKARVFENKKWEANPWKVKIDRKIIEDEFHIARPPEQPLRW